MKYIRVTMPDNSKWDIPTDFIAMSRAELIAYSSAEEPISEKFDAIYEEEFKIGMKDTDKLINLLESDYMRWEDIVDNATRIMTEEEKMFDYDHGLISGKKEVIEK